jgi:hypothetical protein
MSLNLTPVLSKYFPTLLVNMIHNKREVELTNFNDSRIWFKMTQGSLLLCHISQLVTFLKLTASFVLPPINLQAT